MSRASSSFFDLTTPVKRQVCMSEDYPYGYENYESLGVKFTSKAEVGSVDSKETFSIGPQHPESGMPSRIFPPDQPEFENTLTEYYNAMESLAVTLFRGFALALGLESDWFLNTDLFDSKAHQCALRILNYPPLRFHKNDDAVIRAGAHTDYGAMTILLSGGPGLQLCLDPENEIWIDVPHIEGAFIINLGDLMQRWTNDRWRSTLHRVVAVPDDTSIDDNHDDGDNTVLTRSGRRQSIAFFVNMNGNANVVPFESCVDENNPVKYGAIRASDHLMQRHLQSMGKKI